MGLFDRLFGSGRSSDPDITFKTIPEPPEITRARNALLALGMGPLPNVPLRGTAPLPPMTEERGLARPSGRVNNDIFVLQ